MRVEGKDKGMNAAAVAEAARAGLTRVGFDAEKENYMGIVKGELQLHFYIDPVTFQINKIAQSLSGELHIPFGYKLKDDELEFINALQFGHDTLDRYRVRHAYVDVLRNVLFRRTPDGNVVVREKNLEVCGDLIDTKKKKLTYSAEAKAIVSGAPKVIKKIKYDNFHSLNCFACLGLHSIWSCCSPNIWCRCQSFNASYC